MSNLSILNSMPFENVRAILINNEPWFMASDLCRILGHSNPTMAVKGLFEDERLTLNFSDIETGMTLNFDVHPRKGKRGGARSAVFVSEAGLYHLIFMSRLPAAERFKDWVCDEVLPSIRKYGGYIAGQETMTDDELYEKAIKMATEKIAQIDREKAAISAANTDSGRRDKN